MPTTIAKSPVNVITRLQSGAMSSSAAADEYDRRQGYPGQSATCAFLHIAASECTGWRHAGRLPGWYCGSNQGCSHANQGTLEQSQRWNIHLAYCHDKKEIVHRLRDQLHGALAEQDAQPKPQQRADQTQKARFTQDQHKDFLAGHAQRAQTAEDRPSLDDAKSHRVVDEEHAYDERQQAECRQVEAEGSGHFTDRARARCRRIDSGAWW